MKYDGKDEKEQTKHDDTDFSCSDYHSGDFSSHSDEQDFKT